MRQWQCEKGVTPKLNPFEVHGHKPESHKSKVAHWLAHLMWVNLCIIWSLFYSLLHKSKRCGGWGEQEQAGPADWKIFFSCQQLLWEGSLCYIHTVKMRRLWKQCIKSQQQSHTRVFPHTLLLFRKKKTHQLKQLMQMLFFLDIITKFTVLMRVKYIQLVAKIFFKCFHFLFSFSHKFHFFLIKICDLQSKYLWLQARKYKKGGEIKSLYLYNHSWTHIYLPNFLSLPLISADFSGWFCFNNNYHLCSLLFFKLW